MASTGHELGNMAAATAKGMRTITGPISPRREKDSKNDFADREQLARLGKKSVLKVRPILNYLLHSQAASVCQNIPQC
ncbi:hypothetical protein ARSEF1564_009478 [Beauveria bassiana]